MPLFRLQYCSRATGPQDYAGLTRLLRTAEERNAAEGVTGLLCFADPFFFQVLEGPRVAVSGVMGRIFRDPRHTDVTLLEAGVVTHRLFADWAMKLARPADVPPGLVRAARGTATDNRTAAMLDFLAGLADPAR